ncbi:hypothetical protein TNCV_4837841 [Trichonephila clavipes]|nr:hypothetical protein TNCV_4837841 [Trichonephila clavipes]
MKERRFTLRETADQVEILSLVVHMQFCVIMPRVAAKLVLKLLSMIQKNFVLQLHMNYWMLEMMTWSYCNFWLFSKIKMLLKGSRFQSREEIRQNAMVKLSTIPKNPFQKCFQQWKES